MKFFTFFLCSLIGVEAFAGGMSTGGGSVVVCRDGSNKIQNAHLLDLFEGKERFKYTIRSSDASEEDQIKTALLPVAEDTSRHAAIKYALAQIFAKRVFLPEHLALHTSADLGVKYAVLILNGCRLEQVAYYEEDGTIMIVKAIFDKLSPTDRAAFYMHEAIYRLTRAGGATDSATARKFVAQLFSTSVSPEEISKSLRSNVLNDLQDIVLLDVKPGKKFKIEASGDAVGMVGRMSISNANFDNSPRVSERLTLDKTGKGSTEFTSDGTFKISLWSEGNLDTVKILYDGTPIYERNCKKVQCQSFSVTFIPSN